MELYRALAALCERPTPELQRIADSLELGPLPERSEHTEIFSLQLRPYASIYLSDDGHLGGEARDRIGGFWRVLGLDPPLECDHLAVLLTFYAELHSRERSAPSADRLERSRHLRTSFLDEHLLSWLPAYLLKLDSFGSGFYGRWAGLCAAALREDGDGPRIIPPSLHQRSTTPLPRPELCTLEELIALLTSPARSGVLLTRGDLTLAARQLGVAGRAGERAFMLESMLAQAPDGLLRWLVAHLRGQEQRSRDRGSELLGALIDEWTERLTQTRVLIETTLAAPDPSLP